MNQSANKSKKQIKKLKKLAKLQNKELQKQQQQNQIQQLGQQKNQSKINLKNTNNGKKNKQNAKKQAPQPQKSQKQQQQVQNLLQNQDIDYNKLQSNQQQQSNINVTFLVAQIRQQYYHSMKTVLLRYGQILNITQSQITSEILEKANYGNVVVADDDDQDEGQGQQQQSQQQQEEQNGQDDELNVYSILTILPFNSKLSTKIRKLALPSLQKNKSKFEKQFTKLNEIITSPKLCGVLINSRLPNLPSFMVAHSHQVFVSDLDQLKKQNLKSAIFQTQYILNISQVEVTNPQSLQLDDLLFSKFQDYEFCKNSLKWWVGQNVKSQRQKADLRRLYYIIRRKDYCNSVLKIRGYLQDDENEKVQN